jgi:putative addiction module component (TIGR02574 family)
MSLTANQVLQAALNLPYDERSEVAIRLTQSVEGFASPEIEAAWKEEITRRIKEADEGQTQYLTEEEFERRMNEKYGPLAD